MGRRRVNGSQRAAAWLCSTAGFACLPSCAEKDCCSDVGLVTWPRDIGCGFGRASGGGAVLSTRRRTSKFQAAAVDAGDWVNGALRGARPGPVGRRSNTRLLWPMTAPARALASGMSGCGSCMRFGWDGWTWLIDGEGGEGVGPKEVEIGQMDCSERFIRWGRGRAVAARRSCDLEVEEAQDCRFALFFHLGHHPHPLPKVAPSFRLIADSSARLVQWPLSIWIVYPLIVNFPI